jgi:hypothetical protein
MTPGEDQQQFTRPTEIQSTYRRIISPPFPGSNNKASKKLCLLPASHAGFLFGLILRLWRQRRHVPPKRRLTVSVYITEDRTLHTHRCENLKSFWAWWSLFDSSIFQARKLTRNAFKILVGKSERRRPPKTWHRFEDNIITEFKEIWYDNAHGVYMIKEKLCEFAT